MQEALNSRVELDHPFYEAVKFEREQISKVKLGSFANLRIF
jgi:hypothetical protein